MKFFYVKIAISGLNYNRLIVLFQRNNLKGINFCAVKNKIVECDVLKNDYKIIKSKLKEYGCEIKIVKQYGINKLIFLCKENLGIFLGLCLISILFIVSNFFIWQINVFGTEKIDINEISKVLNRYKLNQKNSINFDVIENELMESFNEISLCSVNIKGNTLIVNIKEKITNEIENSNVQENFISSVDGTIVSFSVESGTANIEIGQMVKKGDVLVLGEFTDINGKKVFCRARGNVVIETYVYGTSKLLFNEMVFERTGKIMTNSTLKLFNMDFIIKNKQCVYESYEIEEVENYIFKNNIIPMKIIKTIFYETKLAEKCLSVEKNGVYYKEIAKQNLLNNLINDMEVLEQISFTSNIENGIIFTEGYKVRQTLYC